jgi:hypothetical protein
MTSKLMTYDLIKRLKQLNTLYSWERISNGYQLSHSPLSVTPGLPFSISTRKQQRKIVVDEESDLLNDEVCGVCTRVEALSISKDASPYSETTESQMIVSISNVPFSKNKGKIRRQIYCSSSSSDEDNKSRAPRVISPQPTVVDMLSFDSSSNEENFSYISASDESFDPSDSENSIPKNTLSTADMRNKKLFRTPNKVTVHEEGKVLVSVSKQAKRKNLESMAHSQYEVFNNAVFRGKLPADLHISWSKRLMTTAGLTFCKEVKNTDVSVIRHAAIQLSNKV